MILIRKRCEGYRHKRRCLQAWEPGRGSVLPKNVPQRPKTADLRSALPFRSRYVHVALVKTGNGGIKLNGCPLELVMSETLRTKVFEPVMLLGRNRFKNLDIKIRARGGGHVSQIYAIRQAIAKGIVAFYQNPPHHRATRTALADSRSPIPRTPCGPSFACIQWWIAARAKQQIKEVLLSYVIGLSLVADGIVAGV
eukprot:gene12047-15152_t